MYSKKNLKNVALKYVEKLVKLLAGQKFSFNVAKERIPKKRGVYVIFDKNGNAIYVGKTYKRDLCQRILKDHKSGGSQFRTALGRKYNLSRKEVSKYIIENCSFTFKIEEDSRERVRLEHFAVAILSPPLNVEIKNA